MQASVTLIHPHTCLCLKEEVSRRVCEGGRRDHVLVEFGSREYHQQCRCSCLAAPQDELQPSHPWRSELIQDKRSSPSCCHPPRPPGPPSTCPCSRWEQRPWQTVSSDLLQTSSDAATEDWNWRKYLILVSRYDTAREDLKKLSFSLSFPNHPLLNC